MASDYGKERIPGTPRHRIDKEIRHGTEPFFPNFLLKEWIVGSLFLVVFILWVVFNPVELTDRANPADTSFIPVPDWYFLFLYQLLKYFPGEYVTIGTLVIPGLASLILLLAPWLDRRKERHPFKRPIATGAMMLALFAMSWLTYEAHLQHEAALGKLPKQASGPTVKDTALVDPQDEGAQIFMNTCAACHGQDLKGKVGPQLLGIGNTYDKDKLQETIKKGFPPNMPPAGGLQDPNQLEKVAEWLAKQKQK
jgi:menaquinol-cytochrome c reductase cytochrome b/c subunit